MIKTGNYLTQSCSVISSSNPELGPNSEIQTASARDRLHQCMIYLQLTIYEPFSLCSGKDSINGALKSDKPSSTELYVMSDLG